MCVSKCFTFGSCERVVGYDRALYVDGTDKKVLWWRKTAGTKYYPSNAGTRLFKGDCDWEFLGDNKIKIVEHHNIDICAMILLTRLTMARLSDISKHVRSVIENPHLKDVNVLNRLRGLEHHGWTKGVCSTWSLTQKGETKLLELLAKRFRPIA